MKPLLRLRAAMLLLPVCAAAQTLRVGEFAAEVRVVHDAKSGLPSDDVRSVVLDPAGRVWAATAAGLATSSGGGWQKAPGTPSNFVDRLAVGQGAVWYVSGGALWRMGGDGPRRVATVSASAVRDLVVADHPMLATDQGLLMLDGDRFIPDTALGALLGSGPSVRQVSVASDGRIAVAAVAGLFLKNPSGAWQALYPQAQDRSWAPRDVRGVAFDARGRLWFASPQGAGVLDGGQWSLYTGADGLPYDDFTTLSAGEPGVVWFGTKKGAIRFDGRHWAYRQGRRWLPNDDVRAIAVAAKGDAWLATPGGLSLIERRPMTLGRKARFYEDEIDKRHRRTPYGYVLEVSLKRPGDPSEWVQHDSDNDGLWTSMYGAGECFAFGATRDETARKRAKAAFEALRFLGTVTQGGSHPAPPGFVARTVLPTGGPDPNAVHYTLERDRQNRETRDGLWKVLSPRWPKSADGQWYWKTDTSSDELDGHYFFYGLYYDLVTQSDEEKSAVRRHVAAITDHLLAHNYQLVDHDGKPTRWSIFNPENLNHNRDWWQERGMNSLSILAYLKTAEHITGDAKYLAAARYLIDKHGYGMNVLIPKTNAGPGSGNQSDDEMIFMNYYNLIRYETDPDLRQKYLLAFHNHWLMERPELNPLFNFLYAGVARGQSFRDAFGPRDLSPTGGWLAESVDTLKRVPMELINWRLQNRHRKDIVHLPDYANGGDGGRRGHRIGGAVLPIDERYVQHWNHDPWALDQGGSGGTLADGAVYLLPYYLGLFHRFIEE